MKFEWINVNFHRCKNLRNVQRICRSLEIKTGKKFQLWPQYYILTLDPDNMLSGLNQCKGWNWDIIKNTLLNDGAKRNRLLYLKIMYTQVKKSYICNKFWGNSIFGRKFFFLMLHRQKFAINFEATPFLGGSFFFWCYRSKR